MFEAVDHPGIFLSPSWTPVGGRLYCPVCISQARPPAPPGWNTRSDVMNHLRVTHKWEAPASEDALNQPELCAALSAWRLEQDAVADGFGERLRLVRGIDDFLDECVTG